MFIEFKKRNDESRSDLFECLEKSPLNLAEVEEKRAKEALTVRESA